MGYALIGVRSKHPMIGHDLTQAVWRNLRVAKGNTLLALEPHRAPSQYKYAAPAPYTPEGVDASLLKEA